MVQVVGVRFKRAGKVYYFDPGELSVAPGDKVIVETARGVEYGDIAVGPKEVVEEQVVQPLKKVLRIGTEKDAATAADNKRKEREAFALAQKKIELHGLDMNMVDVEYTFDGSKNIFYFTAEGRVDFRELVRDLASIFRTRIEMRQIGVRDEAKLLGGIGPCGRILCCTSFLGDFAPVSIRMAKDQNLSLNPSKISGLCGRLMCCLRYEQETYEAAKKDPTLAPGYMPPVALAPEAVPNDLEDEENSGLGRRPLIRSGENGFGARIAQALADPAKRTEKNSSPEKPLSRPERPSAVGFPTPKGSSPPRRDHLNRTPNEWTDQGNAGEKRSQHPDRPPQHRQGRASQPQGTAGATGGRPNTGPGAPPASGPRTVQSAGAPQPKNRQQGPHENKPKGPDRPNRHRHQGGNRSKPGPGKPEENEPKP